jgi:hypothetical protein
MKHTYVVAAVAALFYFNPPTAFADSEHNSGGNTEIGVDNYNGNSNENYNSNTAVNAPITTNVNTAVGGAGGKGGEGGKGGNAEAEAHSTSNATGGNATLHNYVHTSTSQSQGQEQYQGQSQEAYSGVYGAGNSNVSINNPRNTASASAPALVAGYETCVQSQSAGGQGPMFGFSIGLTHDNQACERRKNAAMLNAFGRGEAALALMCQDDDVRDAMRQAGTPCKGDTDAKVSEEPAPTVKVTSYEGMQPVKD